jgi:hypothetical protein
MNGERYRGANLGFGPSMQHEPAPGPRTRVTCDDMEMKVSWLASKGKPALEFAAASSRARRWPPARSRGRLRCAQTFLPVGVLRLPSVMKAELEPE